LTRFAENWFNPHALGETIEAPAMAHHERRKRCLRRSLRGLPCQGAQGQAGTRSKARAPETEEPPQMATKKKTTKSKIATKSPKAKKTAKRSPKKAKARKAH
jgi:hypothetical protein